MTGVVTGLSSVPELLGSGSIVRMRNRVSQAHGMEQSADEEELLAARRQSAQEGGDCPPRRVSLGLPAQTQDGCHVVISR